MPTAGVGTTFAHFQNGALTARGEFALKLYGFRRWIAIVSSKSSNIFFNSLPSTGAMARGDNQ